MDPKLTCASLNVNGLRSVAVQLGLVSMLREWRVDVAFVQEHNVQEVGLLHVLAEGFTVVLNPSRGLRGGTLILLSKRAPISVLHTEMDEGGRVLLVRVSFLGSEVSLLNVYAPSGAAQRQNREVFFSRDVLHFLRHDTRGMILGGILIVLRRRGIAIVFVQRISRRL